MATKPRNVDLGPMYLPVGDGSDSTSFTPAADARADDVARFRSVLHRHQGQQRQDETPFDLLLAPLQEPEPEHLADPEEIGSEIAHLWVGTGMQSDREVRMGLRHAMLPGTAVRLSESQGHLLIEFTCDTARVADWLDRKLSALAREVGGRLNRPLRLSVVMADGGKVGSRDWSEADQ